MAETFVTLYQGAGGRVDIGYQLTQSIDTNTTLVEVTAYVVKTNASYYTYRSGPATFKLTVNGNDKTYGWTFNFSNMTLNQRYVITSHSQTVYHNADGTMANVPVSVYCATATEGLGTISGSTSLPIPTIPRASSISAITGGALGSQVTVNISRASASFTHTVIYKRTDGAEVTVGTGQGTQCLFTPALSDANFIPNSTSGTATIIVHTYNGATYIGTASLNFTVTVPASVVPVINSVSITEAVAGIAAQFGAYVQNKSKLAIAITDTVAYSSPINSRVTTILGVNYSGASFQSAILTASGTIAVQTTITDGRGRTATSTTNVTVIAYSTPTITTFTGYRATSGGVQDPSSGAYLRATMAFNVSPVNVGGTDKNTKSYSVEYKLQSAGTWTTLTTGNVFSYNAAFTSVAAILDLNSAYDLRLTISDWFTAVQATFQIGTAFVMMDFHSSGTSMAIGKVAEGNGVLEIKGNVNFDGVVTIDGRIELNGGGVRQNTVVYNFTNGILIDLMSSSFLWTMLTVEITGNGYGTVPINTIFQCYHYDSPGNFIQAYQTNYGANIAAGKWLVQGDRVRLWFPQPTNYGTISIRSYANEGTFLPITVTNDLEPNVTPKVACTVVTTWNNWNHGPSTGMHADILDWHHAADFLGVNGQNIPDLNLGRTTSTAGVTLANVTDWNNLPMMKGVMVYTDSAGLPTGGGLFYMIKIGMRDMSNGYGVLAMNYSTGEFWTGRASDSGVYPSWRSIG